MYTERDDRCRLHIWHWNKPLYLWQRGGGQTTQAAPIQFVPPESQPESTFHNADRCDVGGYDEQRKANIEQRWRSGRSVKA